MAAKNLAATTIRYSIAKFKGCTGPQSLGIWRAQHKRTVGGAYAPFSLVEIEFFGFFCISNGQPVHSNESLALSIARRELDLAKSGDCDLGILLGITRKFKGNFGDADTA